MTTVTRKAEPGIFDLIGNLFTGNLQNPTVQPVNKKYYKQSLTFMQHY